jgi:hypothetical protein
VDADEVEELELFRLRPVFEELPAEFEESLQRRKPKLIISNFAKNIFILIPLFFSLLKAATL